MKVTIAVVAVLAAAGSFAAQPAVAAPRFVPLNAGLLPAMQRDLGLSPDQASTEIAESFRVSRLDQALREALGDAYGGAVFRPATGRLEVGVTDPAKIDAVRTTGADARQVRYSARELDETVARLNAREPEAPRSITGWGVDPEHDRVTMTVVPGHREDAERFLSSADAPKTDIVERDVAPSPHFDVRGGDPYVIAGRAQCSIGFAVTGGFLSAGHCATLGDSITGYNDEPMGSFATYRFPGADFSLARVNSDWTPRGYLANGVRVAGASQATVGASVCKEGSTSGWTCGRVVSTNQTVRYAQGTVMGMIETDVHSEPGDSGAPLIAGNQALGLLSGGDTSTTFFYPVGPALAATGARLVTD